MRLPSTSDPYALFRRAPLFAPGIALAMLVAPAIAFAQLPNVASEIPLPSLTGTDARPMGMGGAGLAISEDASGLYWNPAGLAQMRRIELSASMTHDSQDFTSVFPGSPESHVSSSATKFGNAHLAYPFPVYRGSLVLGLGVDQIRSYDSEMEIQTTVGPPGQSQAIHDTYSWGGTLRGWSVGLAGEASPRLYLGATMVFYEGDENSAIHQITEDVDDAFEEQLFDDIIETESEISSGPTFNIGVLYRAGQYFRIGGTVRTAMNLNYEGVQVFDDFTIEDDGDEVHTITDVFFLDEYDFPPSFGLGTAFTHEGLTVAVDGRYTDWSQISFGDSPIFNRDFRESYEDKFSLNVGGEYLFGTSPFRVRAGYIYDPVPFRLHLDTSPRPTEVEVDREQQFVTFGGGVLVESVLTLDVAFQFGSFTRESALYSEERELSRLYLSSAIRF
jgi:long-subunit fatty acid transport protein